MEVASKSNNDEKTKRDHKLEEEEEVVSIDEEEIEKLKQSLPKKNWMGSKVQLINIQNFWHLESRLSCILTCQKHFVARDTDLIVTSFPKTGTTWLNSLLFSIVNRSLCPPTQSPLLTQHPHELVYDLENGVYVGNPKLPRPNQLKNLPSPRLFHSHLPYASLPESIKTSDCKIVYISRNPLDTFVSHWHFFPNGLKKLTGNDDFNPPDITHYFDDFCQGYVLSGPYFEHVVGYWKQSLEHPNKVLFLKYEDLKEDPTIYVKKLAEFVGVPFSSSEEDKGVVKEIIELCSIDNLKELKVNKSGLLYKDVDNKTFFRKGEVGGWKDYLTPPMVEKMNTLMEQKFGPTGLSFKLMPE